MIKVSEHFYTIQGEGPNAGLPSYLVRFSECNMCCDYCDSKYTWADEGEELTSTLIDTIASEIPNDCHSIIITGGEPSLHFKDSKFLELLSRVFGTYRRHIEIETNGLPDIDLLKTSNIYETISSFKEVYLTTCNNITFNISPKFYPGCYPLKYLTMEQIYKYYELLKYETEMAMFISYKIVYDYTQREFIEKFIDEYIDDVFRNYVYIMPMTPIWNYEAIRQDPHSYEYEIKKQCRDAIEFCKRKNLKYTPRIHVDVYGLKRGV